MARGLLTDNADLKQTLDDVIQSQMPREVRNVFAYYLANGDCSNALQIWVDYKTHMIEDVVHKWKQNAGKDRAYILSPSEEAVCEARALGLLDEAIKNQGTGKSIRDFFPPEMVQRIPQVDLDALVLEDRDRNGDEASLQEVAAQVSTLLSTLSCIP